MSESPPSEPPSPSRSQSPSPTRTKIPLFAHENHLIRTRLNFNPLSEIISDFAGVRTVEERQARVHLILQQRVALERDAGYDRMISQITFLRDVEEWGKYQERRAREDAETAARTQRRRECKAVEGRAEWEKRQPAGGSGPIRRLGSLRLINRRGSREAREVPLAEEDLYLDESRPPFVIPLPLELQHLCNLCHNIKSHPVKYKCGHSNCYVCIRVELETSWSCPTCEQRITARPVPHQEEAAAIAAVYPEWDPSRVEYRWDGLVFPNTRVR